MWIRIVVARERWHVGVGASLRGIAAVRAACHDMVMSVSRLAAAAHYAHELHARHAFAYRESVSKPSESRKSPAMLEVASVLRAAARSVLPVVVCVAELDAVPLPSIALAEALYADRPRTETPRPPWHWGFVALVRAGVLSWGRDAGAYSSEKLVEQLRLAIPVFLPDAPSELVEQAVLRRDDMEAALVGWREQLAIREGEDWEASVARAADWLARAWTRVCGVRLAYDSELQLRVPRRRIPHLPRAPFQGVARLVDDRVLHPADEAALLGVDPAGDAVFGVAQLGRFEPGVMAEPDIAHWRVARGVAAMLEQLEHDGHDGVLVQVSSGLRHRARSHATTLLAVASFDMGSTRELGRAAEICATWMELATRGMRRWQAVLVGVIQNALPDVARLLEANEQRAIDVLLRESMRTFGVELPDEFDNPAPELALLRGVGLTSGRPSRAAVGPHGFANKWCSAYGVEFPPYPSSQRPTRSARRLRVGVTR